jgi:hypothetical protein
MRSFLFCIGISTVQKSQAALAPACVPTCHTATPLHTFRCLLRTHILTCVSFGSLEHWRVWTTLWQQNRDAEHSFALFGMNTVFIIYTKHKSEVNLISIAITLRVYGVRFQTKAYTSLIDIVSRAVLGSIQLPILKYQKHFNRCKAAGA